MIIVYYRWPDEKIRHAHEVKNLTFDEAQKRVVEYNNTTTQDTAYAIEVAENSLEAYLMDRRNNVLKWKREDIQDAIESLECALDSVRSLMD